MVTNEVLKKILAHMPSDWLRLTTHRLDIYNEELAKVEFLKELENKVRVISEISEQGLSELPTAFDYIRLGHPLSCLLEWRLASESKLEVESVISFSSQVMPILAVLRKNKFLNKKTQIIYKDLLPSGFNAEVINSVYGYDFELLKTKEGDSISPFEGTRICVSEAGNKPEVLDTDFIVFLYKELGSVIQVMGNEAQYISEIQHVRRRESIAMTPQNCLIVLKSICGDSAQSGPKERDLNNLMRTISSITRSSIPAAVGSCGLSVQYAIMMGLVHYSKDHHAGKDIKFIVPPNCYGGTNDQARRVAACIDNVEVLDLAVDSGKDMVQELEKILHEVALEDGVSYIIAEIPTNPRVEIPDLEKLRLTLKKQRMTKKKEVAIEPTFILDQTFCPNVEFFGSEGFLHDAATISYVSGSKFPSGGLCTAGYCVANEPASQYMSYIKNHLRICDNSATGQQVEILTKHMPAMNDRIAKAYANTRGFVNFIEENLVGAKVNFVTQELAAASFTPSVFSLDLPTKGETPKEREDYKRELNHKLIRMMIEEIPEQSKHCVSYGQLKGCYWTIPATSTQGTTKESDKDYIVRVSVGADFDLEAHKSVFNIFSNSLGF